MTDRIQSRLGRVNVGALCVAMTLLVVTGTTARAQPGCAPEDFTAWAVNRGESVIFLASSVDIHITRWSTEAEKTRFARALLDRGAEVLLEDLRNAVSVGQIRTPNTFSYELQFAWQEPLDDGGRRIILITDRPMVVWKEAMQQQLMNDAFTVIELRLTADGEGEGKVAIGSNIHVNRSLDLIELKDYDIEPVRLTDVRTKRAPS
jgi:hypothetical protein